MLLPFAPHWIQHPQRHGYLTNEHVENGEHEKLRPCQKATR